MTQNLCFLDGQRKNNFDNSAIHEKLLLKSKVPSRSASLQTTRVPRSNVLDRLQSFLPQMAQANESLKQQMESVPAGHFDIENTDDAEKVIEMDVALVELSDSDSNAESSEDDSSEDCSDNDTEEEEEKLQLPGDCKRKKRANIEIVDKDGM
ncbi:uncharacterized protein C12orf45 homolog isoform X2 [Clupea harengus]|uniref:Uncharacterized protein C12orf45 homolog isoform X2 n=1 Tax=Clupea harengus TaxID=7950 RepID=A0A6P8GJH1_CLUHA|nr:uncharacterized protein C12orf45 homolog isoform X2 [Clupea harengus]